MGVKKNLFHGLFGQCSSLLHEEYFKFKACWFTCTFISFYFLIPSTLVVNAGYLSWNFVFIYKTPEPGQAYTTQTGAVDDVAPF